MAIRAYQMAKLLAPGIREILNRAFEWEDYSYPREPKNGARWTQMYHEELARALTTIMLSE